MSTRILILKDGVITPSRSSTDINNVRSSLGVVDLTTNQIIGGTKSFSGSLLLPTITSNTVGTIWRNIDTLEYKDNTNTTRRILNSEGNLSNLANRQIALNNLVGVQTANRLLRSDGTNTTLSLVNLVSDVTGTLPVSNGGASSLSYTDLTTNQTIAGNKTFSGITSVSTAIPGTNTTQAASTAFVINSLSNKADLVGGVIPASQLPSYVDDVLEFANLAGFPTIGETGKIYVAIDTNLTYRWSGTVYSTMSSSLALGVTSTTAYRGDFGNTAYTHSQITSGNPHGISATLINLGNVNNTSDANKPISTAQQTALNLKANLASPTFTGTVAGITSTMVGLGNLTNSLQLVASSNLSDLVNRQTALNNISGAVTTATYLRGNGTNIVLSAIQATDVPTLNQNTTGTASNVTGIVGLSNGGTGSSTQNFVDLTTTQSIAGIKTFTNTTQATSSTTGSVKYLGGVGIVGNLWVGGTINQTNNHSFKAAASASQNISAVTFTKVIFNSEITDTNNQYDPSLSRLTATTTETWRITIFITFQLSSSTRILLNVYKNGTDTVRFLDMTHTNGFFGQLITIPEISLVAGDYLEIFAYVESAQATYGDASLNTTYWFGKKIN